MFVSGGKRKVRRSVSKKAAGASARRYSKAGGKKSKKASKSKKAKKASKSKKSKKSRR